VISVYLVDDHRMFLSGLEKELGERFAIVGASTTVDEAVEGILATSPDVVLLDVHLPNGGGRAIMDRIGDQRPDTTFLALSVSDAPQDVIALIRSGARGYVTKTIGPDDLADAIERVHGRDAVFSPRLAGFVLDAFHANEPAPVVDPDLDLLTPREVEVLRQIARGFTYKQVAHNLDVSVKTVETHMTAVLRKLRLASRNELTKWAYDRRLI